MEIVKELEVEKEAKGMERLPCRGGGGYDGIFRLKDLL